jgi:tetratricopeptide (TPR) repeat protein
VAPILFERCAPCHRPGGAGPFSLLDGAQARKRARQIARVTRDGYMPPWLPAEGPVRYAGERRLTPAEIATLAAWSDAGAPLGDPSELPAVPHWPTGWMLGEPDLVLELPAPYELPPGGGDVFRNLVIPVELDRPRWVRAYELRPSPPRVVHHAVINVDRSGAARRLDALDAAPGYSGMNASGVRSFDGHIVAWTPGKMPRPSPPDVAWRIDPGSDLVLHLHLLPTGKTETVRASLGLYFAAGPPAREPVLVRLGSKTIDIPAGDARYTIEDSFRVPVDVEALVIYPHAHYLGHTMEAWAEPAQAPRLPLLRIDDWDFNWQDDYTFAEPVALAAGTLVRMRYTYDNSAANARNPSHPPRRVSFGPRSTDEMGDLWLQLVPRDPHDAQALRQEFDRKDTTASLAGYEAQLARLPDQVDSLDGAGLLYLKLGRLDDAERVLRRAVELDPRAAPPKSHLGLVRQARGDKAGALALFRAAVDADPRDAGARTNLGVALRAAGDTASAIEQYRAVLASTPGHARAEANLGVALQSQGRVDEAIAHYRRALELEPDSARSRFNLASALVSRGASAEAAGLLREAVQLDPRFGAAWSALAEAYAASGQLDPASDAARRALELAEGADERAAAERLANRIEQLKGAR